MHGLMRADRRRAGVYEIGLFPTLRREIPLRDSEGISPYFIVHAVCMKSIFHKKRICKKRAGQALRKFNDRFGYTFATVLPMSFAFCKMALTASSVIASSFRP